MKARRALLHDAVLGASFVVAGAVAFGIASTKAEREWDSLAAVLAGGFVCTLVFVVTVAVRQLRRAAPLPESVTVLPWYSVTSRAMLCAVVAVAALVYFSMSPSGSTWVLGIGSVIVGLGYCGIAVLAFRTERRHDAWVVRTDDNGYFLAR